MNVDSEERSALACVRHECMNLSLGAAGWMWFGHAGPLGGGTPGEFTDRLEALSDVGWKGVGLVGSEFPELTRDFGVQGLHQLLSDSGIQWTELELDSRYWFAEDARSRTFLGGILDAAATLGVRCVKLVPPIGSSSSRKGNINALEGHLKSLLTSDAASALQFGIETMAISEFSDIAIMRAALSELGSSRVGLVLDTWHLIKTGITPERLMKIVSPEDIKAVELAGALDTNSTANSKELRKESADSRMLAADSSTPLGPYVEAFLSLGWNGPWDVEVLSEQIRQLPLRDSLQLIRQSFAKLLSEHTWHEQRKENKNNN